MTERITCPRLQNQASGHSGGTHPVSAWPLKVSWVETEAWGSMRPCTGSRGRGVRGGAVGSRRTFLAGAQREREVSQGAEEA